jgi:2-oxo-3-hexenedioate decarboxylase
MSTRGDERDLKAIAAEVISSLADHRQIPAFSLSPRKTAWQQELANFRVELYRDGKLSQTGGGAFVLDSPLLALRHLVELLANDPHNPPLRAGEIISTGTLTLAMPVSAGESWTTRVHGIPLEDIALRIEA